jgi:hypothetical protein
MPLGVVKIGMESGNVPGSVAVRAENATQIPINASAIRLFMGASKNKMPRRDCRGGLKTWTKS